MKPWGSKWYLWGVLANIRPRFQVSVVGTVWMWGQRETSTLLGTSSAMSNLTALPCLQRLLQVLERGVLYNMLENSVGCSLEEHLAYPLLKCMTNFIFFFYKKSPRYKPDKKPQPIWDDLVATNADFYLGSLAGFPAAFWPPGEHNLVWNSTESLILRARWCFGVS